MKKVLFLCTGNYYRSRFAEEYFNFRVVQIPLLWQANSLGLQRDFSNNGNVGPISKATLAQLAELGIQPRGHSRMPAHVYEHHFEEFDRVVAVSRAEHQPMLENLWSMETKTIDYFDVEDIPIEKPRTALPRLARHVDQLINDLVRLHSPNI